jgi:hypothetical protein
MRKVMVMTLKSDPEYPRKYHKVDKCEGLLHGFSTDSEETSNGIIHCPVGIVELADGSLDTVAVTLLRMLPE